MRSREEFEALVFEKAKKLENEQAKSRHKKLLMRKYTVLFIVVLSISAFCTVLYKRNTYCGIILPDGTSPEYYTEGYVVSYAEPMNGTAAYGETEDLAEYYHLNNNNNNNNNYNNLQSAAEMNKQETDFQPKYAHDPDPMIIYLNSNDEICRVKDQDDVQTIVNTCDALQWNIIDEEQTENREIPDFEFTVRYYSNIEEEIFCKEYYIDIYKNKVYKSETEKYYISGGDHYNEYLPAQECVLTDEFVKAVKKYIYDY